MMKSVRNFLKISIQAQQLSLRHGTISGAPWLSKLGVSEPGAQTFSPIKPKVEMPQWLVKRTEEASPTVHSKRETFIKLKLQVSVRINAKESQT